VRLAQLTVIGGGAAQYLDLFQAGMRHSLIRSGEYSCTPEFLAAEIGNVAGAVGAAVLSLDTWRSRPVPLTGSQTRTPHGTVPQPI